MHWVSGVGQRQVPPCDFSTLSHFNFPSPLPLSSSYNAVFVPDLRPLTMRERIDAILAADVDVAAHDFGPSPFSPPGHVSMFCKAGLADHSLLFEEKSNTAEHRKDKQT